MSDTDSRVLMERARIVETVCRWAACLDRRDWDGFGQQFTDPVEIAVANPGWDSDVPPRMLSRAQWTEVVRSSLAPYSAFQHLITNYQVDVRGDEAYAMSYVIAPHIVPQQGGPDLILNMGGYYDEYLTKRDGRWRISRHKLNLLWTHGDPEALALIAKENTAADLKS